MGFAEGEAALDLQGLPALPAIFSPQAYFIAGGDRVDVFKMRS